MAWFFRRRRKEATLPTGDAPATPFILRRRYRADTPYILPNDFDEVNRLDFQHFMVRTMMRGLFWSPLRSPLSVLDVGTGTGRWAREMAQTLPNANVVGVDLKEAPINVGAQPDPENVTFVQGNLLEGLPFADRTFDLVHQRFLISGIPLAKWQPAINELTRVTRPGGWVELTEAGLSQSNSRALQQMDAWVGEMLARRNLDITLGSKIDHFLHGAGLQHVTMRPIPVPLGPYSGRLGVLAQQDYFATFLAMRDLVTTMNIATPERYDAAMAAARHDVENGRVTWAIYVAYGQRGS